MRPDLRGGATQAEATITFLLTFWIFWIFSFTAERNGNGTPSGVSVYDELQAGMHTPLYERDGI